jgi:hypothetical protein
MCQIIISKTTLYWSIGREIPRSLKIRRLGSRVIDRLGSDLQKEFPGVEGYSPQLEVYAKPAEAWPEPEKVSQLVALLPWVI